MQLEPIIKSLAFDSKLFLAQVVLFVALIIVLNQVYWKPMLAHLAKRDQSLKDAHKTVNDTRHEMEALRADYQARIIRIEAEARTHIQQAIREAQAERERILTDARTKAETALRDGVESMEREKQEALEGMKERMVGIALSAVDKAFGGKSESAAMRKTIESQIAARN